MRIFFAGGSTSPRILGGVLHDLYQGVHASQLEDLLGLKVRDIDGIEVEVTYDDMIGMNEKNLLKSMKVMIKKYQLPIFLSVRVKPMR